MDSIVTSEAAIEEHCVREMRKLGALTRKLNQVYGDPDRLFVLKGKPIVVEFKRPGEELKPHQAAGLARWENAGALALVSHNWAELREQLEAISAL